MIFYSLKSQEITFSDPYSEKIVLNPAYSGINYCSEINLTYNKNFIYDYYSVSFNKYINKYKSGIGVLISNLKQGNGALNNFKADFIYSYKIKTGHKSFVNTAMQISYLQQNVNINNLTFNDQINPISGNISQSSGENSFSSNKKLDFSIATVFISNKYRAGVSVQHIDKIIYNYSSFNVKPFIKINIGKVFSVKKKITKDNIRTITPEIIYYHQGRFNQILYGVHLVNNIFLTRFFIKHSLNFKSVSGVFTLGLFLKSFRLSYSYDMLLTKNIGLPISSNQLTLTYIFKCKKKRNGKNAIFCLKF